MSYLRITSMTVNGDAVPVEIVEKIGLVRMEDMDLPAPFVHAIVPDVEVKSLELAWVEEITDATPPAGSP